MTYNPECEECGVKTAKLTKTEDGKLVLCGDCLKGYKAVKPIPLQMHETASQIKDADAYFMYFCENGNTENAGSSCTFGKEISSKKATENMAVHLISQALSILEDKDCEHLFDEICSKIFRREYE